MSDCLTGNSVAGIKLRAQRFQFIVTSKDSDTNRVRPKSSSISDKEANGAGVDRILPRKQKGYHENVKNLSRGFIFETEYSELQHLSKGPPSFLYPLKLQEIVYSLKLNHIRTSIPPSTPFTSPITQRPPTGPTTNVLSIREQ